MPQFNLADALPQVFWLAVIFTLLLLSMRSLLPRVEKVVEDRKERIAADLGAAASAKEAAVAATSGGSGAVQAARAAAGSLVGAAKEKAAQATAQRLAAVDAELSARAEAAEAALAEARGKAIAELDAVAAEATVELVRRLANVNVSWDVAAQAVAQRAA